MTAPSASSPKLLAALGIAVFVATLIAHAPASLLASSIALPAFSYESVDGTVWKGVIKGAVVNGTPMGDVSFRVRPLALLTGKFAADLDARGGAVTGRGSAGAGIGGYFIQDADLAVDLGGVRRYGFMGAPLEGRASAKIDRVVLSAKGCRAAAGTIWTNALNAPARRLNGEGFDLDGAARCDGRDLVIELSGQGAEGGGRLAMRLKPGLTYTLEASAQPVRADLEEALVYMGFQRENGVLTYASTGAIRAAGS
ncbi:MAG: type II secretion system protein N [Amphiplicatus sp.]